MWPRIDHLLHRNFQNISLCFGGNFEFRFIIIIIATLEIANLTKTSGNYDFEWRKVNVC